LLPVSSFREKFVTLQLSTLQHNRGVAAAGLLDGRRAATRWRFVERLRQFRPQVDVDPEAIYLRDGNVWTSAGVTAGIDLALALIEADFGRAIALAVARAWSNAKDDVATDRASFHPS
jgi:transcriptional regulator GlxA family with amidase domain